MRTAVRAYVRSARRRLERPPLLAPLLLLALLERDPRPIVHASAPARRRELEPARAAPRLERGRTLERVRAPLLERSRTLQKI